MIRTEAHRRLMRSTDNDLESRGGRRSRYASVALVAVVFGVSGFAFWSSETTSSATSGAVKASGLSDDYAAAAGAVAAQESLERKYRLEPGPGVEARYDKTAEAFAVSLVRVRRDGNGADRTFVESVLAQHEEYLRSIDRLFRAVDRGDTAAALRIDEDEVDPSFATMETAVLDAADAMHEESLSQLASLKRLEDVTRTLTPMVFLLGLLLAAALAGVSRAHRRLLGRLSDHHEGILASVGEGVIGVDVDGVITFANAAAGGMLGAGGDSLLGTSSCAITCDAPRGAVHLCVLDLVEEAGTVVTRPDEEFLRVDGVRFPVEVTAAPQRGRDTSSGVVLVFRDTTERLAMSRMKSEFVTAVSHELRTPLTSIRGALELLNDGDTGDLPPLAGSMVATALRGSERLSRLISDIIDVERIEANSFPMRLADIEVRSLVDTAVAELRVLAAQSGVELLVTTAIGRTRCDGDRLMQALVNLIGNAVKFSSPGETVEISAKPVGEFVQFAVTDSGRGIPETELELIFERFHQVDVSTAREGAGTGLGLPITKSIVEQHGGRIWVDSLPGRGSTFRFTIPAGRGEGQGGQPLDLIQLTSL